MTFHIRILTTLAAIKRITSFFQGSKSWCMPKEPLNLSTGISSQNGYLKNINFKILGLILLTTVYKIIQQHLRNGFITFLDLNLFIPSFTPSLQTNLSLPLPAPKLLGLIRRTNYKAAYKKGNSLYYATSILNINIVFPILFTYAKF